MTTYVETLNRGEIHHCGMLKEAFRHGGRGYVVKSAAPEELITAVRTVSKKKRYVNARFAVGA